MKKFLLILFAVIISIIRNNAQEKLEANLPELIKSEKFRFIKGHKFTLVEHILKKDIDINDFGYDEKPLKYHFIDRYNERHSPIGDKKRSVSNLDGCIRK